MSAVSPETIWAGGSEATWLRSVDGGASWRAATVPGATDLDFRGVQGLDANTAFLVSSGKGDQSRVYGTVDGGAHWTLLFTNPDPDGFFDALAFWDRKRGLVLGDAVNGRMTVFTTEDAGRHWSRQQTPAALPGEGAFAASNSCLTVRGKKEAWFGTGGAGLARVFHSTDGGHKWVVSATPIRAGSASAGIFSIAFSDGCQGIVVGGDYTKDHESRNHFAVTSDGGKTWTASGAGPAGFRSAVTYVANRRAWVATGTSGSDISRDGGKTWRTFDRDSYNALTVTSGGAVWAAGAHGRIAVLQLP